MKIYHNNLNNKIRKNTAKNLSKISNTEQVQLKFTFFCKIFTNYFYAKWNPYKYNCIIDIKLYYSNQYELINYFNHKKNLFLLSHNFVIYRHKLIKLMCKKFLLFLIIILLFIQQALLLLLISFIHFCFCN